MPIGMSNHDPLKQLIKIALHSKLAIMVELLGVIGAFGGPPASLPKKLFRPLVNSGGSEPLLLKQNFPLESVWHSALYASRLVSFRIARNLR
jgi:hypothetical protein